MNILGFIYHVHGTAGLRIVRRILLVLIAVEAAAFVAFRFIDGQMFSHSRLRAERRLIARGEGEEAQSPAAHQRSQRAGEIIALFHGQTLHPFVGFVFDPDRLGEDATAVLGEDGLSRFGFLTDDLVFAEPREDRVVIGITGGSVGMLFSIQGRETLVRELGKAPELAGKEVVVTTLALPGFKQPQQLFSLNYFLILGAHFDWIINLDGFNEIGLSVVENVPKKVAPFFPRAWYWNVHEVPDPEVRDLMGQISLHGRQRRDLAQMFSAPPLSYSVAWNLLWKYLDRDVQRDIALAEGELVAWTPTERAFAAQGPWVEPTDDETIYQQLVDIWSASSRQMNRLCASNGIRYFHFLQPNQYVPDSKPLAPEERATAWSERSPFREPIARGYPRLVDAGEELRAEGVPFHDLSRVFAGIEDWIYSDPCCHYNEEGNRLLARAIAALVLDDLRSE